ncbi:MAG: flagellar type III secretion system pore protein FliP [Candidatus Eremiobacteraeota bacterium]|nr:flagellar type III secretion system pore protein FliP [Candidatus Eremiobacteraeota bacterium]
MKERKKYPAIKGVIFLLLLAATAIPALAQEPPEIVLPKIQIGEEMLQGPQNVSIMLQLIFMLTVLSLSPYILVMATSFIRITIVLSFIRTALGTQQVPPTQILMGLALFMTLYIMMPVAEDVNKNSLQPYFAGKLSQAEMLKRMAPPIKDFMLKQTRSKDLKLFIRMAKLKKLESRRDVPMYVLLPAFVLSEITTAFQIGFILYLPFLIIDMVVASVLMSMGMFMLSPMSISLPFKLLLFVMIDGWDLVVDGLVKSFKM